MTDQMAALVAIVHNNHPTKEACLAQFTPNGKMNRW